MSPVQLIPEAAALLSCAAAVVTDLRGMRIPNRLTGGCALLALGFQAAHGLATGQWTAGAMSLLAALCTLVLFSVLSLRGLLGFGDTKLLGALALWLGPVATIELSLYMFIAGGPLALIHGLAHKQLKGVARNLASGKALTAPSLESDVHELHKMPYALAIAAGTLWTVLARHFPLPSLW